MSGIVYVIKHGLQWKDAPRESGPHKTLYNRFMRRSRMDVFDRIFANLASEGPRPERIMIDRAIEDEGSHDPILAQPWPRRSSFSLLRAALRVQ